ncbi:uncharacterized protein CTHT_0047390 [Thermochaetoides thermophila DSM 1495]|uniref:Uncharacterized protein n=1 Tax=Chaetomium thermophilum (strain DSM 1495 / CBS 144.50 / IMI 039719) TaxID=759272 RepID=G0S9W2_CHATD|nr:hypothetical protein CTHT_0047390 [Thermochaetoides thermophila DSM 1495]EGS20223.1 hypothetical protein CTHT_0047390 [Thermochaetoides thermophila DSM 1495]
MPDGMDHNLLGGSAAIDGASGTAAGVAASAAGAAVASSAYHRDLPSPSPVQPMQQAPVSRPLVVPIVPTRPDNRRISVFTSDTGMTGSAFTPSSVSPNSTNFNMLPVPGMARTAKPQQAPPDPPVGRSANARFSVDSMSSVSTSSCVTAALSPGQMAWPMPPGTPPAIRHPGGPQYIDFEQTGRTVVRINLPPCGHRPGY